MTPATAALIGILFSLGALIANMIWTAIKIGELKGIIVTKQQEHERRLNDMSDHGEQIARLEGELKRMNGGPKHRSQEAT